MDDRLDEFVDAYRSPFTRLLVRDVDIELNPGVDARPSWILGR